MRVNGESNGGTRHVDVEPAPAASSSTATTVVALLSLLLVASVLVFSLSPPATTTTTGIDGSGKAPREPVELALGFAGHESWLDALRAWAKLASLKLRAPEQRYDVKEAAKKSLEMGKETVEHTAESAARAAGETLEMTAVKVKRKVSQSSAARLDGDL